MKTLLKKILFFSGLSLIGLSIFFYILLRFFHFSTNSAALYLIKDRNGLRISNDISFYEIDSLVLRIDLTDLFNRVFETSAMATGAPILDVNLDTKKGRGLIKEFRPDGSRLEIGLSRFDEEGIRPQGLFIGGDFPPGDSGLRREASGIAFYDGKRWHHLWCNANEGIALSGGEVHDITRWRYLGARIIKRDFKEFIGESLHSVELEGNPVLINRKIHVLAGRNFIDLIIDIKNASTRFIAIDYAYGDEPWIGDFGTSRGDVGWYPDGLVTKETYIDPWKYNIAGFWDAGNPEINERGDFTGLANYIQWIGKPPTMVYFSNDFYSVNPARPLADEKQRLLNLVWKGIILAPQEVERIQLRIGYSTSPVYEFGSLIRIAQ